jgi:hypothetical protein
MGTGRRRENLRELRGYIHWQEKRLKDKKRQKTQIPSGGRSALEAGMTPKNGLVTGFRAYIK